MASCTLDASVKIYSCRVDSIHQETFKVLGGLSRSGKGNGGQEDGEGEGEGEEGGASKKRSQRSVNTIEVNPNNLNVKKFDLEFDVDPLFHKVGRLFACLFVCLSAVFVRCGFLFRNPAPREHPSCTQLRPPSRLPCWPSR